MLLIYGKYGPNMLNRSCKLCLVFSISFASNKKKTTKMLKVYKMIEIATVLQKDESPTQTNTYSLTKHRNLVKLRTNGLCLAYQTNHPELSDFWFCKTVKALHYWQWYIMRPMVSRHPFHSLRFISSFQFSNKIRVNCWLEWANSVCDCFACVSTIIMENVFFIHYIICKVCAREEWGRD